MNGTNLLVLPSFEGEYISLNQLTRWILGCQDMDIQSLDVNRCDTPSGEATDFCIAALLFLALSRAARAPWKESSRTSFQKRRTSGWSILMFGGQKLTETGGRWNPLVSRDFGSSQDCIAWWRGLWLFRMSEVFGVAMTWEGVGQVGLDLLDIEWDWGLLIPGLSRQNHPPLWHLFVWSIGGGVDVHKITWSINESSYGVEMSHSQTLDSPGSTGCHVIESLDHSCRHVIWAIQTVVGWG